MYVYVCVYIYVHMRTYAVQASLPDNKRNTCGTVIQSTHKHHEYISLLSCHTQLGEKQRTKIVPCRYPLS